MLSIAARRRTVLAALLLIIATAWPGSPVHANIRVDIDGVDGDVKRNVIALLSLERYKDRERLQPEAVQRLYNRVDGEVRSALRPFGFYAPKITATLQALDQNRNWRVHIAIDPGTPVIVDQVSVKIDGAGRSDPVFEALATSPPIHPGDQLSHAAYDQLKTALERAAATYGYLDARMVRNELEVDPQAHRANIYLEIKTGARYRFGATRIDQNAVRAAQIRRFMRYREGDPFDATKLLRTQFALDDSQYFSTVEVLAGTRDPATLSVPIDIHGVAARRSYSLGGGYGTDTGIRGTASLTVPHVTDRGERFRVLMQLSQITQTVDSRYDVPIGDPALDKLSFRALAQQSRLSENVSIAQIAVGPNLTQIMNRWQRVLTLNYEHTVTTDPISARRVDNMLVPSITFASVPEGYLGEALFSRGFYIQLQGSDQRLGARTDFLRLDAQAERVFDLTRQWHVLLRGEMGTSTAHDIEDLPGQYRFFAGGDRSVRGFGYDELSPTVLAPVTGAPVQVGGRHLVTGTFELERDLPRKFGVAAFFDIGNTINHFNDPLAQSVGVGIRWRLPVVTVGLDVAQAIRAPGFARLPGPRLHLNISPRL